MKQNNIFITEPDMENLRHLFHTTIAGRPLWRHKILGS